MDQRDGAWWMDRLVQALVFIGGISGIVFVVGIFVFVTKEGLSFVLETLDIGEFFTSIAWRPTSENPTYGALALMVGTASVTGLAMLVSVPLALGAAIYIGEFATGKTREALKVLVELLAAIPSVVWGFIGLSIMSPLIIDVFDVPVGLNVLNAGVILGLMAAPIMTTIAEDALKAVPDTYREAAEALGATRWEVIWKVVIPAGRNGLVAAVLLGVGRGFGEDHGRTHGDGPRDQHTHQSLRLGSCTHCHDCGGVGGYGLRIRPLRVALRPGDPAVHRHVHHQPHGRRGAPSVEKPLRT